MMPLAFDPTTGQLVYSPATGQLALDCPGEPVPGEDCTFCTDFSPKYITAVFTDIVLCDCINWLDSTSGQITSGNPNQTVKLTQDADNKCLWEGQLAGPWSIDRYTSPNCVDFDETVEFDMYARVYLDGAARWWGAMFAYDVHTGGNMFSQKVDVGSVPVDCTDIPNMNNSYTACGGERPAEDGSVTFDV